MAYMIGGLLEEMGAIGSCDDQMWESKAAM
jgi:hypothetical protein